MKLQMSFAQPKSEEKKQETPLANAYNKEAGC
jgi:hypothetical protein